MQMIASDRRGRISVSRPTSVGSRREYETEFHMALPINMRPALTKMIHGPPATGKACESLQSTYSGFEVDGLLRMALEDNLTLLDN